jgi:hypothetical protein
LSVSLLAFVELKHIAVARWFVVDTIIAASAIGKYGVSCIGQHSRARISDVIARMNVTEQV